MNCTLWDFVFNVLLYVIDYKYPIVLIKTLTMTKVYDKNYCMNWIIINVYVKISFRVQYNS